MTVASTFTTLSFGFMLAISCIGSAQAKPRVVRDVPFARVDQGELRLDLYLP